jgi:hypothetical protein
MVQVPLMWSSAAADSNDRGARSLLVRGIQCKHRDFAVGAAAVEGEPGIDVDAAPVVTLTLLAGQLAGHHLPRGTAEHDRRARIGDEVVISGRVLAPAVVGRHHDHPITVEHAQHHMGPRQAGLRPRRRQHGHLDVAE